MVRHSRRLTRPVALTAALVLLLVILPACDEGGGSGTGPDDDCSLSVTVAPATAEIEVGGMVQLAAAVSQSDCDGVQTTWTSSATGVAMVESTGLVTGVGTGSTVVTARAEADGESATGSATITVVAPSVASVEVSPANPSITQGGQVTLSARLEDAGGSELNGRDVVWSSATPSVATVSQSGVVTGVGVGSTTITATSEGVSGGTTVTVAEVPVATVTVSPSSVSIVEDEQTTLTAEARDAQGGVLTGRAVTWSTSSPDVATVADGVVTGVGIGTATIRATSEGKVGSSTVTVTSSGSLHVGIDDVQFGFIGQAVQLSPVRLDGDGKVVAPAAVESADVQFSSNLPGVVSVSADGLMTAVSAGNALITVTSGAHTETVTVTVIAAFELVTTFGGNTYGRHTAFLNWTESRDLAQRFGGRLVVIGSEAEDDFITTTYTPEGSFRRNLWIGMHRVDGSLEWVNGAFPAYSDFGAGQPEGDGDCVHYWQSTEGQWNDIDCSLGFNSVVEFENDFPVTFRASWVHDGALYLQTEQTFDWEGARRMAESLGGSLVIVQDQAEMNALLDHADGGWIGLRDRDQEGTFTWVDGSLPGFTAWAAGQPNGGASIDCVAVDSGSLLWVDRGCEDGVRAIFEFRN
ncbi:MAG: Ig-like domain-containing protein [Gemmatimonadota bacterium]|jgi:uncharacterized protein YjdB